MTQIAISHVGSVSFSTESGRGVAIVVCIAMSGRELASTAMLAHTQLWQLLSLFFTKLCPNMWYEYFKGLLGRVFLLILAFNPLNKGVDGGKN